MINISPNWLEKQIQILREHYGNGIIPDTYEQAESIDEMRRVLYGETHPKDTEKSLYVARLRILAARMTQIHLMLMDGYSASEIIGELRNFVELQKWFYKIIDYYHGVKVKKLLKDSGEWWKDEQYHWKNIYDPNFDWRKHYGW